MNIARWLIGIRNVLIMLLGIEILLGVWILFSDPGFHDFEDTIGLLRYTVFNTWAFLFLTSGSGLPLIIFSLIIDLALIAIFWRFPMRGFTYRLATIYFLFRLGMGLYSSYATPYCACEIGSLTKTLIQGGALSNIVLVSISGLGVIFLLRRKGQQPAVTGGIS